MTGSSTVARAARRYAVILAGMGLCAAFGAGFGTPAAAQSAAAIPPPAATAETITVSRIIVRGNRRVEDETVRSYLVVMEGVPFTAADVNDSVRRLFDTGLFRDAQIGFEGDALVVQVAESPTINRINFEGNRILEDDELLTQITSRPRRAFTRSAAESDAQRLIDIYRRTGRYGAQVEPVFIEQPDNRVDLVFEIEEGPVTGVNSISFVGNQAFSDRRLRGEIETSETFFLSDFIGNTDVYDPDRLEFDKELLRRYYLANGYADFTVLSAVAELSPDRDGFFITFTLDEGEVYDFGELTVATDEPSLDPEEFAELIDAAPGETYDSRKVERTIDRMVFLAGQKGFAFIDIRPVARRNEAERTVDIVFQLAEGARVYVDRINIEGNDRTLDRVIRRQFAIAEGDAFNAREVQKARAKIRGLGFFADVDVETTRGDSDDRAVIDVTVEEQSTGALSFGVGFSSADGVVGTVELTERNFLGRGQFVRARVTAAGDQQVYDFTFREPAFLDRDLEAGVQIFYRDEDLTDESSFEETNIGFVPSIEFPVSEFGRLQLNYTISQDEIRDVSELASPLIQLDEGTQITSALGYQYSYDRRDDPLDPSSGYLLRFGQQFAGLGGDAQYVSAVGRAKGFLSFLDSDIIASLELEAGGIYAINEDLRITDRFSLGGDRFRGFESGGIGPRDLNTDDALGGNLYAVARSEVSFPLGLPEDFGIFGGLFADVGTLFKLDRTQVGTTIVDDDPKLRASVGASIFWDSGFGPLRVNFAIPVVKEDFDNTEFFRLTADTRF